MQTAHNLPFEAAPWEPPTILGMIMSLSSKLKGNDVVAFRVGTCEGIYQVSKYAYQIIAVTNSVPGNGHFEDVLQWFESSCRRDGKNLVFMEIMNENFGKHLVTKRGFKRKGTNCVKKF